MPFAQMLSILLYHAMLRGHYSTGELNRNGLEQTALGGLMDRDDLDLNFYKSMGLVRSHSSRMYDRLQQERSGADPGRHAALVVVMDSDLRHRAVLCPALQYLASSLPL